MISSVDDATEELWVTPTREECERLRGEALREIQPGHELHGVELRAIAKCRACDDVAFACGDGTFAIVRLSYQAQERPPWPDTSRIGSYLGLDLVMSQHEH